MVAWNMKQPAKTFFRYFPVSARDRRWGLWLNDAGESRIPAHAAYPPAKHPGGYQFEWVKGRTLREYQIVYISTGRGVLETKGNLRSRINAGDAFILFPGVWHRYRPDPQTGWNEHWVGCDGPIIRGLVRSGFFSRNKPVLRTRQEELLLSAFASMMDAIHANRPALQQVMAGSTLYILSLLYSAQQPTQDRGQNVALAIEKAMRQMNNPEQSQLDLAKFARSLHVSYTWFRRRFAQHTGLSPHQYRLQLQIGRARTLLSDSSLAVKEIAYQTGFSSEYYFCRIFKKKCGMTPSKWRKEHVAK